MPMEKGFYDGRRGQKRLKAIEKQIAKVNAEFDNLYIDDPEMIFLNEEIKWEGSAKLTFIMALRNVNYTWDGIRDYGFLRLCRQWIADNDKTVMTPDDTAEMLRGILPVKMCHDLSEQLAALDIV